MSRRLFCLVAALFALTAVVAGACWVRQASPCWIRGDVCPGLRVGGQRLAAGQDVSSWLEAASREVAARAVEIVVDGVPEIEVSSTLGALGLVPDAARTAELVRRSARQGTLVTRFLRSRRADRGEIDVPWAFALDEAAARRVLDPVKEAVDTAPVPARFDVSRREIRPETPGRFVDLEGAYRDLRVLGEKGGPALRLLRVEVSPRVSARLLRGLDVSHRLARFETGFSRAGEQASRARNIETAAAKLDGMVLFPGEVFSFNEVVGPRTAENGFSKGWQIFKGEMVEGIGGGTCQVASTLHAAALLAGIDILERLPHSRPSAYIAMGLDATVVYPVVDLKLRNPFPFPVALRAEVAGDRVSFELFGREQAAQVVFGREVLATRAFDRKVEEMPGLSPTRVVRKQHGIRGYKIRRTRTISFRDGTARRETNVDIYPPTVEKFLVAPGVDLSALLPREEEVSETGEDASAARRTGWVPISNAPKRDGETLPTSGGSAPAVDASVQVVDAPGAHAPTPTQARAPQRIVIAP